MKFLLLIFSFILLTSESNNIQDNEPWVVPESAQARINPIDLEEDLNTGRELYMQYCRTCHGKSGLGDGPQANQLGLELANFTSEGFQAQTDGSIFYKISTGRGLMPEFQDKVDYDEDRWLIVNYIRSLADKK